MILIMAILLMKLGKGNEIKIGWFKQKKLFIMKHKFLLSHTKDEQNVRTFGDIEIEKQKFHFCKNPIF